MELQIADLLNAMPGAVAQGLIWGIMAIGVYITFKIQDVADLTVDGTMSLGGAVCVTLIASGQNIWVAILARYHIRYAGRINYRNLPYKNGNPGNPCRYFNPAWIILH